MNDLSGENFKKELQALLKKYDAMLMVEDFDGYLVFSSQVVAELSVIYGSDESVIRPYTYVELGTGND